jgi:predicted ATP-dependent Lon-type protease
VSSYLHLRFTDIKFSHTERKTTLSFAPRTRQELKGILPRFLRDTHFNNIYSYRERKAEEKKKETTEMTGEEENENTEMTSEEGPKEPKKK